eukprot:4981727-Pleurochrysis_carterae.AAC.1
MHRGFAPLPCRLPLANVSLTLVTFNTPRSSSAPCFQSSAECERVCARTGARPDLPDHLHLVDLPDGPLRAHRAARDALPQRVLRGAHTHATRTHARRRSAAAHAAAHAAALQGAFALAHARGSIQRARLLPLSRRPHASGGK